MNLIINAGQAMFEQAPGKISIRTEFRIVRDPEATPETAHLSPGEFVALEVEDTPGEVWTKRRETGSSTRSFQPRYRVRAWDSPPFAAL